MRTEFTVKYPIELVRTRYGTLNLSLKRAFLFKNYPFLRNANFNLTVLNRLIINTLDQVKSNSSKRKSKEEQKVLFKKLLNSNEVKNQSEIAKRFNVSRAWVSMVINS